MGSVFGGKQKTTSKTEPWAAQQPFIKDSFQGAQDIYNDKKGSEWYTGDLFAGMDDITKQGVTGVQNYATGAGGAAAGQVGGTAADMLSSSGDYRSAIDAYRAMAGADPTQANIKSAGAYADNPYLTDQITAASRDVTRNLKENDLPAIDRAATGTGNINSTRAGVASGIAMRGAQDRIGDISASMRGDAYDRGLNMAETARQANMSGMGSAAGMYGDAVRTGFDGAELGQQMNFNNYGQLVDAGNLNQANAQGQMDADFTRWQGNDTRDQDLLNQYYGIVGANNWGGTTTSKTSGGPGILGGVMGLASSGLGIASGMKGLGLFGK